MKVFPTLLLAFALAGSAFGQVTSYQKISDTEGGFAGALADGDGFGSDLAPIGDLDQNGVVDLAVGAPYTKYNDSPHGAVWILQLGFGGSVVGHFKIQQNSTGFPGSQLSEGDDFGWRVVGLGDVNGDFEPDFIATAPGDDDGGTDQGAVYILYWDARYDDRIQYASKLSSTKSLVLDVLDDGDQFGYGLDTIGELNSDGFHDVVVGAPGDDDGGADRGAVWVLELNKGNGTIKTYQKISGLQGTFYGALADGDRFGAGVASLGDVDGDGVHDLAVGAPGDGTEGAVWILFLNSDATVKGHQKISKSGGGVAFAYQAIGEALSGPGDLDGDGIPDLVVGDPGLDGGGENAGGLWVLFLNRDGTVRETASIGPSDLGGGIAAGDAFPSSVRYLGDVNGDGAADFGAGHPLDDDGGPDRGAAWIQFSDYEDVSAQKLEAPVNGSGDTATNVNLVWKTLSGALSYNLQVSESSTFSSTLVDAGGLIGTEYPLLKLTPLTTYYWRVQPASLDGPGDWSATWAFTTGIYALSTPVPLEPAHETQGVSLHPTLTWTPVAGAATYDLEVSNMPFLDPLLYSITRIRDASETIGPIDPLRGFYWRVRAIASNGESDWSNIVFFSTGTGVSTEGESPYRFALDQNYPNPFNPSTTVSYELPVASEVTLIVVDMVGRVVRKMDLGWMAAGRQSATLDAGSLPTGVYSYRLDAGDYSATRSMVLIR